MPTLIQCCQQYFHTSNLYEVLGVEPNIGENDLKKAYYKMSLKVHPDRDQDNDKEKATKKFQTLGQVYSILSDAEKRAVYDETGTFDEEYVDQERDWSAYWRLHFKNITIKDIEEFKKKYQGSNEEKNDLIAYFEKYEGDMDKIMECVPCGEVEDEPRFKQILEDLIKDGVVQDYPAFSKEKADKREKRKKKFQKEAAEAEKVMKSLGLHHDIKGDGAGLELMIKKRQQMREQNADNFFAHLEAKYGNSKSPSRKGVSCQRTSPLKASAAKKTAKSPKTALKRKR